MSKHTVMTVDLTKKNKKGKPIVTKQIVEIDVKIGKKEIVNEDKTRICK